MKKTLSVLLAAIMLTTLSSCGTSSNSSNVSSSSFASTATSESDIDSADDSVSQTPIDSNNPWAAFDTSKAENLVVYVIGTEPNDMADVLELINARMSELINTTIDIKFVSLADFPTKYPLILTGGDDVDLMYTSSWAQFTQNAAKGAFYELTEDFLQTYMPETYANEAEAAWNQIKIDGKIYAVPRNQTEMQNYGGILIRDDLAQKYGFDPAEMDTLEEYEEFLYAIADGESEIYGFYNFPSNLTLWGTLAVAYNHMFSVYDNLVVNANKSFNTAEDLEYIYMTDEYKTYALKMAEWAEHGVWPSNAMSGTTHTNDLFKEGKSASMFARVTEADSYISYMENKGVDVDYICILPQDYYTRTTNYSGDCMAITSFCKDPERAAIALDVMKNDYETNMLIHGGIEGVHYILNDDGTRSVGEKADDYSWNGWAWGLRNDWNPGLKKHDVVQELEERYYAQIMPDELWVWDGFTGSESAHSAEKAVVDSLVSQYAYSFDLGVFGSETETQLNNFWDQLKQAGIDDLMEDWKAQAADFLASK